MSKTHVKPQASAQAAQTAEAPSGASTTDVAAAVVQPTATAQTDEHHGHGGLYTVQQGQRVLVERTASADALTPSN